MGAVGGHLRAVRGCGGEIDGRAGMAKPSTVVVDAAGDGLAPRCQCWVLQADWRPVEKPRYPTPNSVTSPLAIDMVLMLG
jgi:hypothetical protein